MKTTRATMAIVALLCLFDASDRVRADDEAIQAQVSSFVCQFDEDLPHSEGTTGALCNNSAVFEIPAMCGLPVLGETFIASTESYVVHGHVYDGRNDEAVTLRPCVSGTDSGGDAHTGNCGATVTSQNSFVGLKDISSQTNTGFGDVYDPAIFALVSMHSNASGFPGCLYELKLRDDPP